MNNSPALKPNIKLIISHNIINFMKERNLSRRDVCNDLNIKYTTFCDWANGKITPKIENLEKLAGYFSIDITDFFIETNANDEKSRSSRLIHYLTNSKELPMSTLKHLSDDQIQELIVAGFRFEHKTLEQYVQESEYVPCPTPTVAWGEKMGDEIW